jgi:hypothetical protein
MDDWLKTLKPGDEVCYEYSPLGNKHYVITTVAKITSAGNIKTADGKLFVKGFYIDSGIGRTGYHLMPATDEIRSKIRRSKLIARLEKISFYSLTNEQLEAICGIAGIEDANV